MQLTIPASPAHLAGLRHAARASLDEVPGTVADEMVLALNEAATNAVLYGSGGGHPVRVRVLVEAGWVEATVLDRGPDLLPLPNSEANIDLLGAHGRGLWLLSRLVDQVCVERVERGTLVTLRRRIPRRPAEPAR